MTRESSQSSLSLKHEELVQQRSHESARRIDRVLGYPAVDELLWKQPLARDARRRKLARRDQRVDLLLVQLEVSGDLGGGEVLRHEERN